MVFSEIEIFYQASPRKGHSWPEQVSKRNIDIHGLSLVAGLPESHVQSLEPGEPVNPEHHRNVYGMPVETEFSCRTKSPLPHGK